MNTARGIITAKAVRKEEKEERKAKEKVKEKTRNQLQIPVSKATAEHVENGDTEASECWQGYVQAVEEVPSSSVSKTAASKTAALIQ